MPSLKMKSNLNMKRCLREKSCLQVCKKSTIISKDSCPCVKVLPGTAELDARVQNCQDVSIQVVGRDEAILIDGEDINLQKQGSSFSSPINTERMEFTPAICPSTLDTIFSPILEAIEIHGGLTVHSDEGNNKDPDMFTLREVDPNDNSQETIDYQTCNISDFYISDMIVAGLPHSGGSETNATENNACPDYICAESSLLFNVADRYMFMPIFENTVDTINTQDFKSSEESMVDANKSGLYLAIDHLKSCNQESNFIPYLGIGEDECFDPNMIIKDLPDLSDSVSKCQPTVVEKQMCKRKPVTLVLDLDETLVHSTLEMCDDADFSFPAFFNMKEHMVYVKERPFLRKFLDRVAEMFEIVVFTASQSVYAEQLLDVLDPHGNIISQRFYRESCIFSEGSYTKDLTILGVDLAKVAIIDNSPQVFQLQVNNGIPIKSWFNDPSDSALISLLPFLETLVDADDVRPIIAKRFGN